VRHTDGHESRQNERSKNVARPRPTSQRGGPPESPDDQAGGEYHQHVSDDVVLLLVDVRELGELLEAEAQDGRDEEQRSAHE
jgi:hypothetical protein